MLSGIINFIFFPFKTGKEVASLYVTFPCGLIRGALQALAVPAVVTVDVSAIPSAQFTIKVKDTIISYLFMLR